MADILMPNNAKIFQCKKCDFECCKKSNYDIHLLTGKHKRLTETYAKMPENAEFKYSCQCGKKYKHRQSLHKHTKFCQQYYDNDSDNDKNTTNAYDKLNSFTDIHDKGLIIKLLQHNNELQKSLIELSKEKSVNNTHNNSHNKTFNLQFFLNETCKDALNISDFVSSIKLQLSDLETTGRIGYVQGISNIILNNLKSLNAHDRPIHCSDLKREVIYIKDNDEWTKENETKPILTKAIKVIANENIKQISEWTKENPDCTESESKKNNMYLKIVSNSMSGLTKDETNTNINKIITNIAKEVIIDKE